MGVLLWRHLMPQRKAVIWVHNYTPSGVQLPQSYSGKYTSYMTFDAHKHVRSEPFLEYLHEVWQLLLALCSDVRNFFCIGPKPLRWNFIKMVLLKYFCYLYEVVRTNFSAIFRLFAISIRNFAKIVAPSSNKNEDYLANLKGKSILKKTLKTASKSTNKQRHKTCSKYTLLERTARRRTYKHHIFTPTVLLVNFAAWCQRSMRCSISPNFAR